MNNDRRLLDEYVQAIRNSGKTIYDRVDTESRCWLPDSVLEDLLTIGLGGLKLAGIPLRTRSKVVKKEICRSLGYPVPLSFTKTQPRFPGQNFDTYVQKSNNLQVWNEEISLSRRYVLILVSEDDVVFSVKVVTGRTLASYDSTGTFTQKFQARISGAAISELVSSVDTRVLQPHVSGSVNLAGCSPLDNPSHGGLLSIASLYRELERLVGVSFRDSGTIRDRTRGAELHALVCRALGYRVYQDNGQFPDVLNQLLEVKLQTASTIDLGLVSPDSEDVLGVPALNGDVVRHCDVRYAVFYGNTDGVNVALVGLCLLTGEDFFVKFSKCMGNERNKKLQIPIAKLVS